MSMFTLAIPLDHFQFTLIHGPDIPGSYAVLLFTTSDLASITSHIHSWVLFLLWLRLFILSGVISPLIFSSILGTYRPGEFIFQSPIFLSFHTVHGVLTARILKDRCMFNFICVCMYRWRRQWHPTPVLLPGKSHGWGSLVSCCLWGCTESDMTEVT